ncbi:DUF2721 domain-containing protein [Maritalea mediterranea]|uniref:DUF2721 domain-containing protein n=1 Tax=Maritalea mediterranea TaxID=2909667 RepID=A0ABS9E7H9_9HYPH|nr:DUF2721 domain-containing protein [Maritalea mediterranea]MCF4098743.1 DUF2721 domain-containing protein [Maritalea mediterranea]
MESILSTSSIAEEIQLSVAPVFLLTAIGGLLNVLAGRLNRIVDRLDEHEGGTKERIRNLRRIAYILWSSRLSVAAGILICLVVVFIFLGDYVAPDLSGLIAFSFILAMLLLTVSLALFLLELTAASERNNLLKARK